MTKFLIIFVPKNPYTNVKELPISAKLLNLQRERRQGSPLPGFTATKNRTRKDC